MVRVYLNWYLGQPLKYFQQYLTEEDDVGMVICDNRTHSLNRNVSHSIFTQKFKKTGDDIDRIIDLPTFAVSDNHAGIQVCDLLCSALLYPMFVHAYCAGYVNNLHVQLRYIDIRSAFSARLKDMQYRYKDPNGIWRGGITVSDNLAARPGSVLFQ